MKITYIVPLLNGRFERVAEIMVDAENEFDACAFASELATDSGVEYEFIDYTGTVAA